MGEESKQTYQQLFLGLESALVWLKSVESLEVAELDHAQRERLTNLLEEVLTEGKRVLQVFGNRCPYCRTAPADLVGECEKCGGVACTNCATVYNGVILHRGTCAAFYGGTPDS